MMLYKTLILIILISFSFPSSANSLDYLVDQCEKDDAESCLILGYRYEKGTGISKDFTKAIEFFTKSCNLNSGDGCARLGGLYERGSNLDSFQKNEFEAVILLRKACGLDSAEGCYRLGSMHQFHQGGLKGDSKKYAALYKKACDIRGSSGGCGSLASLYAEGEGVKKDLVESARLSQIGCSKGDEESCKFQILFFAHYFGQDNISEAISASEVVCDLDSGLGCARLGFVYLEGKHKNKNIPKAITFLDKACDLKDRKSCVYLGFFHEEGVHVKKSNKKAVFYYRKSCALEIAVACNQLGLIYEKGKDDIEQDDFIAFDNYKKSCDIKNGTGCYKLGLMYEEGKGVRQSVIEAKKLYGLACDEKSKDGCKNYARLNK